MQVQKRLTRQPQVRREAGHTQMPENDQILALTSFTVGLIAPIFAVPLLVTHNILGQTDPATATPLVLLATWRQ